MSPYPQPYDQAVGLPASAGNIKLDTVPWYRDPKSLILLGMVALGLGFAYRAQKGR